MISDYIHVLEDSHAESEDMNTCSAAFNCALQTPPSLEPFAESE